MRTWNATYIYVDFPPACAVEDFARVFYWDRARLILPPVHRQRHRKQYLNRKGIGMRKAVIVYDDDDFHVKITLSQATGLMGIRRTVLSGQEADKPFSLSANVQERIDRIYRTVTYPACLASVVSIDYPEKSMGLPEDMSADDFMHLPEALIVLWEKAALELNPHWVPEFMKTKEAELGESKEPSASN